MKYKIKKIDKNIVFSQKIDEGCKSMENKNYEQAIKNYSIVIKLNPSYEIAYLNRVLAYTNLGNYSRALKDYSKAIDLNPNLYHAYNNRRLAYYDLENYEQAIKDFTKAKQLGYNQKNFYIGGKFYERKNNLSKMWMDNDRKYKYLSLLRSIFYRSFKRNRNEYRERLC